MGLRWDGTRDEDAGWDSVNEFDEYESIVADAVDPLAGKSVKRVTEANKLPELKPGTHTLFISEITGLKDTVINCLDAQGKLDSYTVKTASIRLANVQDPRESVLYFVKLPPVSPDPAERLRLLTMYSQWYTARQDPKTEIWTPGKRAGWYASVWKHFFGALGFELPDETMDRRVFNPKNWQHTPDGLLRCVIGKVTHKPGDQYPQVESFGFKPAKPISPEEIRARVREIEKGSGPPRPAGNSAAAAAATAAAIAAATSAASTEDFDV